MKQPPPPHEGYLVPSTRRRLLVALLAVATAVTIGWLLLYRPGGVKPQRLPKPDTAACQPGQQDACVGGRALVISVPPAASAAAR